ncbi:hypothetical protein [Sinomicrobium soli]|uniref:hypothetical protein n=1 Tax=Sinomicrobium sp. N-1-3-6 TaxID=2219864 RepID=UPI000DCDFB15|nr:hypothetical protein [Sinomicrobium sp. N-1-3-6]RAV29647.1 hypothetical protein DN748_05870 [Sinomicrobium sp. N-1-3-6]
MRLLNNNKTIALKVITGIAIYCAFAISNGYGQKVVKETIVMGAQGTSAAEGGFLDLQQLKLYDVNMATLNQGGIDLAYTYGKNTGINFMSPSSTAFKSFGQRYREIVFEKWNDKNKGTLIAIEGGNKEMRKAYRKVKSRDDLIELYKKAAGEVVMREGYNRLRHGPGARITRLKIGDLVVFRSVDRDIYAIGQIVNHEDGYSGSVTVDWKAAAGN